MSPKSCIRALAAVGVAVVIACTAAPAHAAPAPTITTASSNTLTVTLDEHADAVKSVPKAAGNWCANITKALTPASVKCVTKLSLDIPAPIGGVGGVPFEVGVTISHPTQRPSQATMDKVLKVLSPTVPFSQLREVKPTVSAKLPPRVTV